MINTINGILEAAKGGKTGVIAVAAAHDQPVIEAVVEARKEGIATPILVGHVDEIKDMLSGLGENPADYEIVAGDSDTGRNKDARCFGQGGKNDSSSNFQDVSGIGIRMPTQRVKKSHDTKKRHQTVVVQLRTQKK